MQVWGRPLIPVAILCLATFFFWPIVGATGALAFLSISLIMLIVRHAHRLRLLMDWLANPKLDNVPAPAGTWEEVFAAMYRLLRDQNQARTQLSAALGRFERASEAMPDAVVLLDESGHIEWLNRRAGDFLGLELSRDRGQQVTNIVRQPQFGEYLSQGDVSEALTLRVQRGGQEQVYSLQVVPYGDQRKLLLCRDVTQLEQVETMRRDFVANVSHEVRTPLTVITGFLETLLDMPKPDPDMTRRSLKLMDEQANRMKVLVEDLLTLSRLESAANPLHEQVVDVALLVRQIYQEAQALSAGRHRVVLQLKDAGGLRGSTDELRSAFTNLITNALRYTPEQGEITILWERLEGTPRFSVRDSGIGIDAKDIPRLTERFYRVDRSRSRASGGTGLGLAIVKHILNRHQAQLQIDSELGHGSEFTAVFPPLRYVPQEGLDRVAKLDTSLATLDTSSPADFATSR